MGIIFNIQPIIVVDGYSRFDKSIIVRFAQFVLNPEWGFDVVAGGGREIPPL